MIAPRLPAAGAAAPPLVDARGRCLDYLRLAVTDRCNLRCRYCMPATGIVPSPRAELLRFEEIAHLAGLFCSAGVRRIRLTGGEPLVRRDLPRLVAQLAALPGSPEILLTTNGVLLAGQLTALAAAGLRRVNLSLDSLEADTWRRVTRRDGFASARAAIGAVLAAGLALKLNVVVQPGVNDHELPAFVALARDLPLEVRFIETMGFDGSGRPLRTLGGDAIVARLAARHELEPRGRRAGTVAELYAVAGHRGQVGVIRGHSRTFCADCSRLRLDARGRLRTCLYGEPAANLGALLRGGADDAALLAAVRAAVARRGPDGFAAEAAGLGSMAVIGG